ncbi:uncharacterized protein JCM6883_007151 [Sporobolomyces salmoneus]|uniref:uncharacterized protein n=1 Tax=Sporobolomyces salmoneus TaxID=183962 RepID=UPI00317F2822
MRFATSALLTIASAVAAVAQSALTINTPTALFTCDPYLVSWSGGSAPYTIRAFPSGQLGGTPLETLVAGTSATSLTWTVNLGAGTGVTLAITDSTGTTIGSAPVTIQAGTSTSCIGSSSSAASTGSQGASSAASTAVSTGQTTISSLTSTATSSASSVSSSASSAVSSVSSSLSSAIASVSSRVSTATGAASSVVASATPTSGASTLALSGALGFVGAAVAVFA